MYCRRVLNATFDLIDIKLLQLIQLIVIFPGIIILLLMLNYVTTVKKRWQQFLRRQV